VLDTRWCNKVPSGIVEPVFNGCWFLRGVSPRMESPPFGDGFHQNCACYIGTVCLHSISRRLTALATLNLLLCVTVCR